MDIIFDGGFRGHGLFKGDCAATPENFYSHINIHHVDLLHVTVKIRNIDFVIQLLSILLYK